MWLESGAPVALGEGCSLGVVAGVGVGVGGHAASVKPQQGREEAMKTSPSLLCPSSPDVPPMDWPNLKPEDRGTGRAGERWNVDLEKRRRVSSTLPLWDGELLTRLCLTPSQPPGSAKDTMEFR